MSKQPNDLLDIKLTHKITHKIKPLLFLSFNITITLIQEINNNRNNHNNNIKWENVVAFICMLL